MIKLNHLDNDVMDLVMNLTREFHIKPDEVIKRILNNTSYEEAKRAINHEYELQDKS